MLKHTLALVGLSLITLSANAALYDRGNGLIYKETLSWDVYTEKRNPELEISALKTIAAFLNSDGGNLIIGVADNGEIPGLENELQRLRKNNLDNFLKHFRNLAKEKIGQQYYPYFDLKIFYVDKKSVALISCKKSMEPCFIKGPNESEDFYVRAPAATDKLGTQKAVEYIKNHWGR